MKSALESTTPQKNNGQIAWNSQKCVEIKYFQKLNNKYKAILNVSIELPQKWISGYGFEWVGYRYVHLKIYSKI